jgi:hypothetical protein
MVKDKRQFILLNIFRVKYDWYVFISEYSEYFVFSFTWCSFFNPLKNNSQCSLCGQIGPSSHFGRPSPKTTATSYFLQP